MLCKIRIARKKSFRFIAWISFRLYALTMPYYPTGRKPIIIVEKVKRPLSFSVNQA